MKTAIYIDLGAPLRLGEPAHVLVLSHPESRVLARTWARTTPVRAIRYVTRWRIEFWTQNTHYVPVETDPMPGEVILNETHS